MRTHQQSTRFRIVSKSNGGSAVESASYISRQELTSEVTGETYYPKYHEDLVYSGILLPENAPIGYQDRATLWNSVEKNEKSKKAQLARTLKADLPNDWSYELAEQFLKEFVQKTFVNKGMCADIAIHDSVNPEGQRNLHCHIMLTLRPIIENGAWGAKSKKEYILDREGNRIKTRNGNYKSRKIDLVDWNKRTKAAEWRKALANAINDFNEMRGIDVRWEHRSFKEQGLDIEPQIHLGAAASAMERKGILTERGDINRRIALNNRLILYAKKQFDSAQEKVAQLKEKPVVPAMGTQTEITEMLARVQAKSERLALPVVSAKYLAKISKRNVMQDISNAIKFLEQSGIKTFVQLEQYIMERGKKFDCDEVAFKSRWQRIEELKQLVAVYVDYEPYKKVHDESKALSGFKKILYDKEHKHDLAIYENMRGYLKSLLLDEEKIAPKAWQAEQEQLEKEIQGIQKKRAAACYGLAMAEVISYNRDNLERIEDNERRQSGQELRQMRERADQRGKKKREESL